MYVYMYMYSVIMRPFTTYSWITYHSSYSPNHTLPNHLAVSLY